jgi:hypothetical protein
MTWQPWTASASSAHASICESDTVLRISWDAVFGFSAIYDFPTLNGLAVIDEGELSRNLLAIQKGNWDATS